MTSGASVVTMFPAARAIIEIDALVDSSPCGLVIATYLLEMASSLARLFGTLSLRTKEAKECRWKVCCEAKRRMCCLLLREPCATVWYFRPVPLELKAVVGKVLRESLSSCACRASNGRFVRTVADGIMDGDWCPVIGTAALSPEWRSAF